MTYMRVDVAFPGCLKATRAGGEALWMWLAMKAYAKSHGTNGFVPDEKIGRLEGPKPNSQRRLLKRLVDAKGESGKHGLVDVVDGGYQLHDYLEHEESAEQAKQKRAAARDRKRTFDSRSKDSSNGVTTKRRNTSRNAVTDKKQNGEVTPALPSQAKPSQAKQEPPYPPPSDPEDKLTVCPLNLLDTFPAFDELAEHYRVSVAALRLAAQEFVEYWTIGGGSGKCKKLWARALREDLRRKHDRGELENFEQKAERSEENLREANRRLREQQRRADEEVQARLAAKVTDGETATLKDEVRGAWK